MKSRSFILLAFTALLLCSCAGPLNDIRVTSCKVASIKPSGLAKIEARVEIGIDNPAKEIHLSSIEGLASFKGEPCMNFSADDIIIERRTEKQYGIVITGRLNKAFDLLQLLTLIGEGPGFDDVTLDISCRAALSSGLGRKIDYKDIPLGDIIEKF